MDLSWSSLDKAWVRAIAAGAGAGGSRCHHQTSLWWWPRRRFRGRGGVDVAEADSCPRHLLHGSEISWWYAYLMASISSAQYGGSA